MAIKFNHANGFDSLSRLTVEGRGEGIKLCVHPHLYPLPPREGEEVIKSDFDGHRHQRVFWVSIRKIDDGGV
jgi:hypothetical protein